MENLSQQFVRQVSEAVSASAECAETASQDENVACGVRRATGAGRQRKSRRVPQQQLSMAAGRVPNQTAAKPAAGPGGTIKPHTLKPHTMRGATRLTTLTGSGYATCVAIHRPQGIRDTADDRHSTIALTLRDSPGLRVALPGRLRLPDSQGRGSRGQFGSAGNRRRPDFERRP